MASKSNKDLYIPNIQKSVTGGNTFHNADGGRTVGNYGGSSYNPNPNPNQNNTTEPQTVAEQIAGSSNPELALKQYLYQIGLENIFTDYQKNIAGLDSARQKDIADAYFIREMSKKYLGEYASNVGIGDVSGNLIDIYGKYAENLTDINSNYNSLESSYEAKMLEESRKTSTALLGTEVALEMSEYADTILSAQTDISKGIQTGDYGDFNNYEDYINSLDLPDKYKQELMDWAEQENTIFETTSFTQIKGVGVNQQDLDRFGLTAQPYIDLTYYTSADIMSEYAYSMNGNLYGVATESTEIPTSYLEEISFNYRKDGNGFITYKGNTYVYMADGTFHKMVAVETEGVKIPTENGLVDTALITKNSAIINGVKYEARGQIMKNEASNDMITAFGIITDNQGQSWSLPNGEKNVSKVFFYNGRYYLVKSDNKGRVQIFNCEKA